MKNPWVREGLFYVATLQFCRPSGDKFHKVGTITRKLDFISYHLIKKIHGEQKLIDMAYDLRFFR